MEYPEYRYVLEELKEHFKKGYITVPEIAEYDGIDKRTVSKYYGIKGGCDICILAHKKCQLARLK